MKKVNPFKGKKQLKPSTPYMPAVRAAIDAKDFVKAVDIIQTAAVDYYGRIAKAEANVPVADIALIIKLHRHIANELERADPTAAAYAKAMEPIGLPPIEYQTTKKKEDTQK